MKRLPEAEAQPAECIAVNTLGTQNVIRACQASAVPLCIGISTDKACRASTAYGASKLLLESLFKVAPAFPTRFVYCRYGNVLASNGSVLPIWAQQARDNQPLSITDLRCTRFWMSERDAVTTIEYTSGLSHGEGYVPKMGALNIAQMASMLHPLSDLAPMGLRSLEKLHEDLIHSDEPAIEFDNHFILSALRGVTGHTYNSSTAPVIGFDNLMRMIEEV